MEALEWRDLLGDHTWLWGQRVDAKWHDLGTLSAAMASPLKAQRAWLPVG